MVPPIKKAVFPVAGLGTRFLPATKAMPKEMLTVVDRPLIQYAIEECLAAGIDEFIFVTGRNKSALEDHFDAAYELEDTLVQRGKIGNESVHERGISRFDGGEVVDVPARLAGVVVAVRRAGIDAHAAGDAEQGHQPDRQDHHDDERGHQAPPSRNPFKGYLWLLRTVRACA